MARYTRSSFSVARVLLFPLLAFFFFRCSRSSFSVARVLLFPLLAFFFFRCSRSSFSVARVLPPHKLVVLPTSIIYHVVEPTPARTRSQRQHERGANASTN